MVKLAQGKAKVSRVRRWKARDLAVIVLAGQQGLRVGEIAGLLVGHLERLSEGILYVPTLKLRDRERGTLDESLVDDGVKAALERYARTLPRDGRTRRSASSCCPGCWKVSTGSPPAPI